MSGYGDQTSQTKEKYGADGDIGSGGVLDQSNNPEYDEQGGKKKESIIDKIKDKLPGGNKEQVPTTGQDIYGQGHGGTTAPKEEGVTYGTDGQPEKKGFVEKIKEKLPGGHN